jgi:hypothetical protein
MPLGTESKYVNTIEFFEHVYEPSALSNLTRQRPRQPLRRRTRSPESEST